MIKLNKLAILCKEIALQRGKITPNSSPRATLYHISAEWRELLNATKFKSEHLPEWSEQEEEAADIIITTLTYLESIRCKNIENLIRAKIEFNSKRND